MTTRHTISHADELYRGNAHSDTYSPDGRRGVEMSHLVLYHIQSTAAAAPAAIDADGIITSFTGTSATSGGVNWLVTYTSETVGALVTAGATYLNLDVARNITLRCCAVLASTPINVVGTDLYGNTQYEILKCTTAGATIQGVKAFKTITSISTTGVHATTVRMGTGNKFGLPFHITHKGKVAGAFVDGHTATGLTVAVGNSYAATTSTPTASSGAADVRGTVLPAPAPDGTKRFAVLMEVDASTRWKAFGQLPATAFTVTEV